VQGRIKYSAFGLPFATPTFGLPSANLWAAFGQHQPLGNIRPLGLSLVHINLWVAFGQPAG